ncbi:porin [Candidatus Accumulibacter sp. ACC012]|uniref:porin n=1 Tax=Candidatus Accumulibacter sp. ACC012 TaxID=2823332 RepID=UPI0025BBD438|nr:porin [Candidatus Accumulibacter sp. ACC012]
MAVPNLWGNDINEGYIGASYDFKAAKVSASYQQQNDKNVANNDNTVWSLGVKVPVMAASNVLLTYGQPEMDAGHVVPELTARATTATLAWTTAMSKRTTLYAGYVWSTTTR